MGRRRRTGPVVLAAVLGLVALLLAGCADTAAAEGATTTLAPDQRQDLPVVVGTTLSGQPFDLASWRGKVVVVNFWGSWCVTCRDEAGALERTYTDLKGDGVRFLGIATRDTADNAKAFLRTFPMSYPSLLDDPATNANLLAFRGQLPVASTPTTYVLDREGRIAARAIGAVDGDRLRAMIDPVLAEAS
jgi:thiol-disulfide isomerase/thioredoxin